jgi:hypothetical protein
MTLCVKDLRGKTGEVDHYLDFCAVDHVCALPWPCASAPIPPDYRSLNISGTRECTALRRFDRTGCAVT